MFGHSRESFAEQVVIAQEVIWCLYTKVYLIENLCNHSLDCRPGANERRTACRTGDTTVRLLQYEKREPFDSNHAKHTCTRQRPRTRPVQMCHDYTLRKLPKCSTIRNHSPTTRNQYITHWYKLTCLKL